MKLIIDIPDTQYNNIMEVKSMSLGRIPYKGIIMNAIRGIQNGTPLDKMRAEIDRQEKWLLQAGYTAYNVDIAFDSIKSVLAESEDKE